MIGKYDTLDMHFMITRDYSIHGVAIPYLW